MHTVSCLRHDKSHQCLEARVLRQEQMRHDYVAGFLDGEGCIDVRIQTHSTFKLRYAMMPRVRIADGYIAGFLDAEGCIHPGIYQSRRMAIGYGVHPETRIEIRKGKPVLNEIQDYLADHGITATVWEEKEARILSANGAKDVERLLVLVLPHLCVKYNQAIIMLDKILPLMKQGKHLTREGFVEIMRYVDILSVEKGPNGPRRKYTETYFRNLWGIHKCLT